MGSLACPESVAEFLSVRVRSIAEASRALSLKHVDALFEGMAGTDDISALAMKLVACMGKLRMMAGPRLGTSVHP